uniref:Uncharacterized protein n=1 Tax=Eutreptiella gymnastica TaxID=73025 RepID=A0A6U7U800_9EUGL|mmetsp:Transcript_121311/g.210875  ORF Transcript_121311/g.210875 Transcript_121311/m.210875 type:complete len:128 (+) Transcript_121311:729-1112(+)
MAATQSSTQNLIVTEDCATVIMTAKKARYSSLRWGGAGGSCDVKGIQGPPQLPPGTLRVGSQKKGGSEKDLGGVEVAQCVFHPRLAHYAPLFFRGGVSRAGETHTPTGDGAVIRTQVYPGSSRFSGV